MTLTTLVTGGSISAREAAIASTVDPALKTVILLEGFPHGTDRFDKFAQHSNIQISYIAAGCLCCTGNLVMRVTLNRVLRTLPEQLFIGLADSSHLHQLKDFLRQPSYRDFLTLTEDLQA